MLRRVSGAGWLQGPLALKANFLTTGAVSLEELRRRGVFLWIGVFQAPIWGAEGEGLQGEGSLVS